MQNSDQLHLIDQGNPLLAPLLPERSFSQWAEDLHFDPVPNRQTVGLQVSESHLHLVEQVFIPSQRSIVLAMSLAAMMISSLRRRDPRIPANRHYPYQLATYSEKVSKRSLNQIPWLGEGAPGVILQGPTGSSKSHSCDAYLRLLPQYVDHDAHHECGWLKLRQLIYLRVPMPADFSRKGLLLNIVWKIDEALSTSYGDEINNRITQEQLLVEVLKILAVHRCGLLILEEVQERNVSSIGLGSEFSTVFLKIMNSGVPLALVGNPKSFDRIMSFSQDQRRLTSGGQFDFAPAFDHTDEEWGLDLVPGVWGWSVFPQDDEPIQNLPRFLFERTGGIPAVLSLYRRECLVEAFRAGAQRVTRNHADAAFWSPAMVGMHRLIDAYVKKDLQALAQSFTDQPITFLRDVWSRERRRRGESDERKK